MALLTVLDFPLEATCSCKQDRKERSRNDQTGHSGPPSKLVPNIPVGPNRNGPFHLMNQPKFPDFWVEWKAPLVFAQSPHPIPWSPPPRAKH